MALSYLGCDWDDMQALIKVMQPDIRPSGNAIAKHLQTRASQLSRFHDAATIGAKFTVDSFGSDQRHYLIWTKTQEEAILNVQGIIAEAYIPPITNTNMKSLSKAYQSIKIVSSKDDTQFTNALRAIDRLESFMSRHYSPMEKKASPDMVGTIPAIRAENRLLVSRRLCNDGATEPGQDMDPEGLLRATIRLGTHVYTEDNVILIREWTKDAKDKLTTRTTHPGTLKTGDVVNVGLSFRILHFNGRGRFQIRLDSISVLDRRGSDALEGAIKSRAKDAARDGRAPKKRRLSVGNVDAEL